MKQLINRLAVIALLAGVFSNTSFADTETNDWALNAPTVSAGGNTMIHWGRIVSQSNIQDGNKNNHSPQKWAGTIIQADGQTYCPTAASGPFQSSETDPEIHCNWAVPAAPQINFADFKAIAQLENGNCNGGPCLNPNVSGVNDTSCTVGGQPKVWYFQNDAFITANSFFCGVLVSEGKVTFRGNGGHTFTNFTPPSDAWKQYEAIDTSASGEYPGDSGLHQSNAPVTLRISFQGYIYATTGYDGGGGSDILGAIQFGQGASSNGGGSNIYFSTQTIFINPPAGQVNQPIIFPNGGCFAPNSTVSVQLIDTTAQAKIYYTSNGTAPDDTHSNATLYANPIPVTSDTQIIARGYMDDNSLTPSKSAAANFTFSSGCGGGGNPAPVLSSLVPNTAVAASAAFTLTLNGANFVSGAVATWNGSDRTTTFVDSTRLTAAIPASDIASAGTASVYVRNPDLQVSNSLPFTITGAASTQIQFNPTSYAVAEDGSFAVINVTRTGDTSGLSTVQYASADGTATAGLDYIAVSGKLTFNAGETMKTFSVPVLMDRLVEGNETVLLTLSQVTGATLGASQATLTITDQNPQPPPPPSPFISELVPFSAMVDAAQPFTMRILGSDFELANPQVHWNGSTSLVVLSHTATEIDVTVDPAIWSSTAGSYPVVVTNPGTGLSSNTALFTVLPVGSPNPPPILTSLVPNTAIAGSPAFTLTVNGGDFLSGAIVLWNGSSRSTTFVDGTSLTASITAADIANIGTATVQVQNPDNQNSNTLPFSITARPASQIQFNPTTYNATEDAGFAAITVTRTGDTSGLATVQYASADGTATSGKDYISVSGTLTFNAGDTSKTLDVPVINDRVADGSETVHLTLSQVTGATLGASQATLTITDQNPQPPPPPSPFISELLPFSAMVDAAQPFTMRILGSDFELANPQAHWNGSTSLVVFSHTATEIDVTVDPAIWSSTVGSYPVVVTNPSTSLSSNAALFTVLPVGSPNPPPILTSLVPNTAIAGSPAFTLTVNGGDFLSGAIVLWNGSSRTTTFVDGTSLTASITAADIANIGTATVQVRNPDKQNSNALAFSITARPVSQIQFNPSSYSVSEDAGLATIIVTRTLDTSGTSTVHYGSADGSATAGKDYVGVSGTLTFNPGDTSKTFDVPLINDRIVDGSETVNLTLSQPTGANLGVSQSVLTITDQNPMPQPPPAPFIGELVPYSAPAGFSPAFTMRVLGSDFASDAQVHWNFGGADTLLSGAVVISSSEIHVTVQPAQVSVAGAASVTVVNVAAGLTSNSALFTVQPTGNGTPPPFVVQQPQANPNPTYTKTTQLTVLGGTFSAGGESKLSYDWEPVGAQPSSYSFSANKTHGANNMTATFNGPGVYHFNVMITDTVTGFSVLTNMLDVTVISKPTSLTISPKTQTITPDQTAKLTTTVKDQFGAIVTPTIVWDKSAGSLMISNTSAVLSVDSTIQSVHVTAHLSDNSLSDFADITVIFGSGGVGDINQTVPGPVPYKVTSGLPGVTFHHTNLGTRIRLYSTSGKLVQTLIANSSETLWDLTNSGGDRVSSGVYIYLLDLGGQKKEGKLVIIR